MLALSQHKITDMNLGIDASAIKCTRSWFSQLRKVLWSTENQICGDQVSSYFTSYSLLSHETMSHFALGSFNNGLTLLLTSVMTVVRYLAVMLYYRSMRNYAWMVSFIVQSHVSSARKYPSTQETCSLNSSKYGCHSNKKKIVKNL